MSLVSPTTVRVLEGLLSLAVLVVAAIALTRVPQPYPTWPTIGEVPVNPELVLPGVLGLVAIRGAVVDGVGIGPIGRGILGGATVWVAGTSLYALYAVETGGVFWGGIFTLALGIPLAFAVLLRGGEWRRVHRLVHARISA